MRRRDPLGRLRPPEAVRDQCESAFTAILRRVWRSVPSVLSAAFVDIEGECIDYVSSIDPFDTKLAAAHMLVILDAMRRTRDQVPTGEPFALEIATDTRELWARRVTGDYGLVVLLTPGCDRVQLRLVLRDACAAFRDEAGLCAPRWEERHRSLRVSVRPATAWSYAPEAFWQSDERMDVSDVLGRWHEPRGYQRGGRAARICFRVRTASGQELTLVHHVRNDDWSLRA